MKKRIAKVALALGLVGGTVAVTGCDVFGARRSCTEYRMASFGESYGTAYRICSDAFPM